MTRFLPSTDLVVESPPPPPLTTANNHQLLPPLVPTANVASANHQEREQGSVRARWVVSIRLWFVRNLWRTWIGLLRAVEWGFLRGERGGLGQEWIELDWLKEKRYYGIQEFMANRLEVALRLSWLNCCSNGKKKGVRLKEKASAAGVAENAYWRKKGCVDWWEKLDASTRKNVFRVILGKSAKSLGLLLLSAEHLGESI